jgi:hypothetical protein
VSKRNYWLLFLACQTVGAVVPLFGNVHMNIAPIVLGVLLLFPGVFIESTFPPNASTSLVVVAVVLINGVVWYWLWKIVPRDSATH